MGALTISTPVILPDAIGEYAVTAHGDNSICHVSGIEMDGPERLAVQAPDALEAAQKKNVAKQYVLKPLTAEEESVTYVFPRESVQVSAGVFVVVIGKATIKIELPSVT